MYLGYPLAVPNAGVDVAPPPQPPFALADSATVITGQTVQIPVLANDVHRTNPIDPATVVIVAQGTKGTATALGTGIVSYAAIGGVTVPTSDIFTYNVKDTANLVSNTAQVTVGISPDAVQPPFVVNDTASVKSGETVLIPVLANDVAQTSPIAPATVVIFSQGTKGTATAQADGQVSYVATAGVTVATTDSFTYKVSDILARQSEAATVTVSISIDDPPPPGDISRIDAIDATGSTATITSNSVTPDAGAVVLVCLRHRLAVPTAPAPNVTHNLPTGSGVFADLTFTLLDSQVQTNTANTVSHRISIWSCIAPATTSSGSITVTTSANSDQRRLELINVPAGTRAASPLRQDLGAVNRAASIVVTLPQVPLPDSVVVVFVSGAGSIGTLTATAGYTSLSDGAIGTSFRYYTEYDSSAALAAVTMAGLATVGNAMVVVEVARSDEGVGPTNPFATTPDYLINWKSLPGVGSISQQTDGVVITAGTNLVGQDNQHAQIVSKSEIAGDFEMVFDVTALDTETGSDENESFLLYFCMTGNGSVGHPADLTEWPGATGATRFEQFSTGYRMSFDPLDPDPGQTENQIRLRIADGVTFPLSAAAIIIGTGTPNTQPGSFPFVTNQRYRCTVRKEGQTFDFKYDNAPPADPNASLFVELPTYHAFDAGRTITTASLANIPGNAVFHDNDFTLTGTLKTLDLRGSVCSVPEQTTIEQPCARIVGGSGLIVYGMAVTDNTRNNVITWRQRKTAPTNHWPEGDGIESDNDFVNVSCGSNPIVFEWTYSKGVMDIFNPDTSPSHTGRITLRTGYHKYVDDDFFVLLNGSLIVDMTDYLIEEMHTLVSMDGFNNATLNVDHSIIHLGRICYSESPDCQIQEARSKFTTRYPGNVLSPALGARSGSACPVPYTSTVVGFASSKFHKEIGGSASINYNRVIFRQDSNTFTGEDAFPSTATCTNCVMIWLGLDASGNAVNWPGGTKAGLTVYRADSVIDGLSAYDWYQNQRRIWLAAHGCANKTIDNISPADFPALAAP